MKGVAGTNLGTRVRGFVGVRLPVAAAPPLAPVAHVQRQCLHKLYKLHCVGLVVVHIRLLVAKQLQGYHRQIKILPANRLLRDWVELIRKASRKRAIMAPGQDIGDLDQLRRQVWGG